jgi:acetyl-CoA carboxylase biotin carboxyl carrier protein
MMGEEKDGGNNKERKSRKRRPGISRLKEIREVLDLLQDTDIEEIELAIGDLKVRIKKRGPTPAWVPHPWPAPAPPVSGDSVPASSSPSASVEEKKLLQDLVTVNSPMVGTLYRAAFPEAEPFVEIGDVVEKGKTLCIIEAMKLMNEIEAEVSGTIETILVENAQPVEYGQPLFLIKPR